MKIVKIVKQRMKIDLIIKPKMTRHNIDCGVSLGSLYIQAGLSIDPVQKTWRVSILVIILMALIGTQITQVAYPSHAQGHFRKFSSLRPRLNSNKKLVPESTSNRALGAQNNSIEKRHKIKAFIRKCNGHHRLHLEM